MRVFFAIEIDEKTKKQLRAIQDSVEESVEKGNFTAEDNFHITLKYIGEVDKEEIPQLKEAIDKTARQKEPFKLSLGALGHFPRRQKEIIWVGLKGQLESLNDLKEVLEKELTEIGYTRDERVYSPHITLARQAYLNKVYERLQEDVEIPETEIKVKSISLMESVRLDDKLVYRPVYVKMFN